MKINRLLLLIVSLAVSHALNAQNKKVAVMETKNIEGVSAFQSNMVRGGMEVAVANANGYEGYDRAAFDMILKEQNFQRSGAVKDSDIRRLGEMAGVQYVLVTEASSDGQGFFILAKLLDVETGQFGNAVNTYCNASGQDIYKASNELGVQLFGDSLSNMSEGNTGKTPSNSRDFTETAFGLNMRMIYVEGGTFNMGCTREQGNDCDDDEKNVRQVTVDGFYIGMLEVSQAQWCKVFGLTEGDLWDEYYGDGYEEAKEQAIYCIVGDTVFYEESEESLSYGYKIGDTIFAPTWSGGRMTRFGSNYPVYAIGYYSAIEFCRLLSEQTGKNYTLPTEAQWEYAARGGKMSRGKKYAGSNTIEDVGWYSGNSEKHVQAGGTRSPNELGIYDMCGNVSEWCLDCYQAPYLNYDIINPGRDPEVDYCSRVIRGGSFTSDATSCRVSARNASMEETLYPYNVGLRVVCNLNNNAEY